MAQKLNYLNETPSQTAGPYVHIGLMPETAGFEFCSMNFGREIAGTDTAGERIRVIGTLVDGLGSNVQDAVIEVWQANSKGIYRNSNDPSSSSVEPGFCGWGRAAADLETGEWSFETIKPGCVSGNNGLVQAPHINFWIVARGINIGLNTRMYFADETEANSKDPVLSQIQSEFRRNTIIAECVKKDGKPTYRFDIVLQGENETVFFDI